jgi:hypothetical protein
LDGPEERHIDPGGIDRLEVREISEEESAESITSEMSLELEDLP